MPIHRTRLFYSTAGGGSFHGWLGTWLANMSPWEAPDVTNSVPNGPLSTVDSNTDYYAIELAFDWSEDKSHILDNLDQFLDAYCDWHRIGYHVCTHDETDPTPCTWEETRESGSVPAYVPSLTG